MTDIPENVTLDWLARHLIEFRQEFRFFREETRAQIRAVRLDLDAIALLVRSMREDLYDLRHRVDRLEQRSQGD